MKTKEQIFAEVERYTNETSKHVFYNDFYKKYIWFKQYGDKIYQVETSSEIPEDPEKIKVKIFQKADVSRYYQWYDVNTLNVISHVMFLNDYYNVKCWLTSVKAKKIRAKFEVVLKRNINDLELKKSAEKEEIRKKEEIRRAQALAEAEAREKKRQEEEYDLYLTLKRKYEKA